MSRFLETLAYPPTLSLLLLVAGLLILSRRKRLAAVLIASGTLTLYLASAPISALALMRWIESVPALTTQAIADSPARAIVVIGGGRVYDAAEFGGDTVGWRPLERVRYAARLHRLTGLPILVSGGVPARDRPSEALLLKSALEDDFRVPVRWMEERSHTTWENAVFSAALLKEAQIGHVMLVTNASHMRRAVYAFERTGLKVTPAPTMFTTPGFMESGVFAWWPRAKMTELTATGLHELLGDWWYQLRHRDAPVAAPTAP